jgi:hypothetical protein
MFEKKLKIGNIIVEMKAHQKVKCNKFEIWEKKKTFDEWKSRNIRFKKVQIQEKIRWNRRPI